MAQPNNSETKEIKEIKTDEIVNKKHSFPRGFSHIVYLRRVPPKNQLPTSGNYVDESIHKIGSAYRNKAVLRGITPEEEKRWLPQIIGVQSDSPDWQRQCENYWLNISKEVPLGEQGVKLEVGLRYENEEDYETDEKSAKDVNGVTLNPKGNPIDVVDYILWRYCLLYNKVANNFEDVGKSANIDFYLFSKLREVKEKAVAFNLRKESSQLLFANLSDRAWVSFILRLFVQEDKAGKYTIQELETLDESEKDVALEEYMTKNPAKFIAWGKDKNLKLRADLELWIAQGLLSRIPNTQSVSHDGVTIGNTTEEVMTYLNNPKNKSILDTLTAQSKITKK